MKHEKEISVREWLLRSNSDLESADLLYDHKLYSQALYLLQQSNEKLAKGLLIWIGFLTPRMANRDRRVKTYLGFQPKEPLSYGHRTMRALLSDIDKTFPALEAHLKMLEHTEWKQTTAEFQKTICRSRRGVQKLKKKPFAPIEKEEQLIIEMKVAQEILSKLDQTVNKVTQELDKLDYQEIIRIAVEIAGTKVIGLPEVEQVLSFQKIRNDILEVLQLSILSVLAVAMTSFLDPLESMTRYPDSGHTLFDNTNPYVTQFRKLRDVIEHILLKSQGFLSEVSNANTSQNEMSKPRSLEQV